MKNATKTAAETVASACFILVANEDTGSADSIVKWYIALGKGDRGQTLRRNKLSKLGIWAISASEIDYLGLCHDSARAALAAGRI